MEALAIPPKILFVPDLDNFRVLLSGYVPGDYSAGIALEFTDAFINSLQIATFSTVLALALGCPAGYIIASSGRKWMYLGFFMGTLALPPTAVMMPLLRLINKIGLYDSLSGIAIVHSAISVPLVIAIVASQDTASLQRLNELAVLDGFSPLDRLWRITLPLLAPAVGVSALLAFLVSWNDFFFAFILSGTSIRTVPVVISGFQTLRGVQWGLIAAAGVFTVAPLALLIWLLASSRSLRNALRVSF